MNRIALCVLALCTMACGSDSVVQRKLMAAANIANPDSMGALPSRSKRIPVDAGRSLTEASSAVITAAQPGIVFIINDSGNDPDLFALDTAGRARGVWRVTGATNNDWEALSSGPCGAIARTSSATSPGACLYIADTGDNNAIRSQVALYRVHEPLAGRGDEDGTLSSEKVSVRYPDGGHDVEAVYASRTGDTYLITKRVLAGAGGSLRQALVFMVPASAWGTTETVAAQLVDSLPIVPGSSRLRQITDASLSIDSRFLAVRTYGQVYVFATDSITGRVVHGVKPAVCNIQFVEREHGEGIAWFGATGDLLLDSEGQDAPMHRISCPMPSSSRAIVH